MLVCAKERYKLRKGQCKKEQGALLRSQTCGGSKDPGSGQYWRRTDHRGKLWLGCWVQGRVVLSQNKCQGCRAGSSVELHSSFGKAGWIFSQSRTVQFPQTPSPSPIPRAPVTPEATEESRSASQWQESNWHFTSESTE